MAFSFLQWWLFSSMFVVSAAFGEEIEWTDWRYGLLVEAPATLAADFDFYPPFLSQQKGKYDYVTTALNSDVPLGAKVLKCGRIEAPRWQDCIGDGKQVTFEPPGPGLNAPPRESLARLYLRNTALSKLTLNGRLQKISYLRYWHANGVDAEKNIGAHVRDLAPGVVVLDLRGAGGLNAAALADLTRRGKDLIVWVNARTFGGALQFAAAAQKQGAIVAAPSLAGIEAQSIKKVERTSPRAVKVEWGESVKLVPDRAVEESPLRPAQVHDLATALSL